MDNKSRLVSIFGRLDFGYYIYGMKVWELKDMLFEVPEGMTEQEWDEVDVMMPSGTEFDGYFVSPCMEDSGYSELTPDDDEENPICSFVLVPCGFFELEEGRVPPELN